MKNLEKVLKNKDMRFDVDKDKLFLEEIGYHGYYLDETFTPNGKRYLILQTSQYEHIYTGQYIDVSPLGEIKNYCLSKKMLILLK